MASRSLRRVLAGSLVAAFLSLELPDAPSLWVHVWQWLTEQMVESGSDAGWTLDPDG